MPLTSQKGDFKEFDASKYKVGIVCAEFNNDIAQGLLAEALAECAKYKISSKNITVHKVAGAVELPLILSKMAKSKKFNVLVALGTVIQGDTPHFDYVCKFATEGILRVSLDNSIAIGFGVITCNTHVQAKIRTNFGSHAVAAALHSAKILKEYK
ncbi:MAG: 6,7-dimethyl-8-ribityllumazine synthase [bacterium]